MPTVTQARSLITRLTVLFRRGGAPAEDQVQSLEDAATGTCRYKRVAKGIKYISPFIVLTYYIICHACCLLTNLLQNTCNASPQQAQCSMRQVADCAANYR